MLHSTVVAGEAEEVTDDAGDIVVEGAGGGTGEAVKSKLEGAAEGVTGESGGGGGAGEAGKSK